MSLACVPVPLPGVVLSRVTGRVRASSTLAPQLVARVSTSFANAYVDDDYVEPDYVEGDEVNPALLRALLTCTGSALEVFRPSTRQQMISFIRWSGPTSEFNPYQFKRGTSRLRFTMQGCVWQFSVAAQFAGGTPHGAAPTLTQRGVFPQHIRWGVALYNASIKVLTADGPFEVRLLTNGIEDNASEDHSANVRAVNGTDGMVAYRKRTATILLPPGHGLPVAVVCQRILARAGIPAAQVAISLPSGARMYKPLQLVDVPAIDEVNKILEPHQYALRCDDRNVIRAVHTGRDLNARVRFIFRDQDLVEGGEPKFSGATEGPTRVWINGTRQVLREDGGVRTVERESLSYKLITPRTAAFRQNSDGTLATISGTPVETLTLVGRVLRTLTYEGDTLVAERVQTWGMYNPQAWRYKLNTDGTIAAAWNSAAYLYTGSSANDGSPAYQWPAERLTLLSDVLTEHHYDADTGLKESEVTRTRTWKVVRAALLHRSSASTTWESLTFDNVYVLGNGQALYGLNEQFLLTSVSTRTFQATEDGHYVQRESAASDAYGLRIGTSYLYDDGKAYADASEQFLADWEETETLYGGDPVSGTHSKTVLHYQLARLVAGEDFPSEDGWLPPMPIREDVVPPSSVFDDAEEAAWSRAASRYESQRFKFEVTASAIEKYRAIQEERVSHPYVEDQTTAQSFAEGIILRGYKYTAGFTVTACPWIRPPDRVRLSAESLGIPVLDVFTREVELAEQGDRTLTTISGDVYLL